MKNRYFPAFILIACIFILSSCNMFQPYPMVKVKQKPLIENNIKYSEEKKEVLISKQQTQRSVEEEQTVSLNNNTPSTSLIRKPYEHPVSEEQALPIKTITQSKKDFSKVKTQNDFSITHYSSNQWIKILLIVVLVLLILSIIGFPFFLLRLILLAALIVLLLYLLNVI